MSSNLEDTVEAFIKTELKSHRYKKQHYVLYAGHKLFFDFYLPSLATMIEVQGAQHYTFSKFFHEDAKDFAKHKMRDSLKEEWCTLNDITLVKLD